MAGMLTNQGQDMPQRQLLDGRTRDMRRTQAEVEVIVASRKYKSKACGTLTPLEPNMQRSKQQNGGTRDMQRKKRSLLEEVASAVRVTLAPRVNLVVLRAAWVPIVTPVALRAIFMPRVTNMVLRAILVPRVTNMVFRAISVPRATSGPKPVATSAQRVISEANRSLANTDY